MIFGVFIHKTDSRYEDSPAKHYQFPKQYLSRAKSCEGGWIVYYEPTKVLNSRGYFAVARVEKIIPDLDAVGMYRAIIEEGTYIDFGDPVPFKRDGVWIEKGILNEQGRVSGRAQSAVRTISAADFAAIVKEGLAVAPEFLPRQDFNEGMAEEAAFFEGMGPVHRDQVMVPRTVRDRNFRKSILRAYDERCAMTGLKLINGGGRAEVEAAHIQSVSAGGPDIVSNGMALSGTLHWMFDRGLVSLDEELNILVSRQVNDPDSVNALINKNGKLLAPTRVSDRPHPAFTEWHRVNRFKV